jgi:hypothetical protein
MTTTLVNVDGIPSNSPLFTTVQFIEFVDVFLADLEAKHIDIGTHTVWVLGLGKGDQTGPTVQCYGSHVMIKAHPCWRDQRIRTCAGSLPYCRKKCGIRERKKESKLAYLLRELLQHSILKLPPDEGGVCLDYDAVCTAVVNDGPLLAEGVELV